MSAAHRLAIALFEPEIPGNTGNIIRLAANCGAALHLIKPLGFALDDKRMRRAGLDYHEFANLTVHDNFADFGAAIGQRRILACSAKARASYAAVTYQPNDVLLFGPETRGLPASILQAVPADCRITIPMQAGSRSLNLSNAAAVITYEAWRQLGFGLEAAAGSEEPPVCANWQADRQLA